MNTNYEYKIINQPCTSCGKPSSAIQDNDGIAELLCWSCTLTSAWAANKSMAKGIA